MPTLRLWKQSGTGGPVPRHLSSWFASCDTKAARLASSSTDGGVFSLMQDSPDQVVTPRGSHGGGVRPMWSRTLVAEGRPALALVRPLRAPPDVPENGTAHNIVATPARAWATARNVNVTGRLSDGAAFMDQLSHVSASVVDGELMLFATLVGPALPVDGARLTAPVQRKFCTLPDGPNEPTHGCRRAAERGGSRLDRRPRAATHRRSTRPWRWDRSCRCRSQAPHLVAATPAR